MGRITPEFINIMKMTEINNLHNKSLSLSDRKARGFLSREGIMQKYIIPVISRRSGQVMSRVANICWIGDPWSVSPPPIFTTTLR